MRKFNVTISENSKVIKATDCQEALSKYLGIRENMIHVYKGDCWFESMRSHYYDEPHKKYMLRIGEDEVLVVKANITEKQIILDDVGTIEEIV